MDTVNVIVEIPRFSQNKYEYDHENHTIKLDRHLLVSMGYPAEYGFIPDTLGGDGDPLDALVIDRVPDVSRLPHRVQDSRHVHHDRREREDEKLISCPTTTRGGSQPTTSGTCPRRCSTGSATSSRSTRTWTRVNG